MKRRDAMELVVIGAAIPLNAQVQHEHGAASATPELQHFFTPAQLSLVDVLSEMIIPADKHSGGAREAQVPSFIDDLVATSGPAAQKAWTDGLAAVDTEANKHYKQNFVECNATQRDSILKAMAAGEESPKTELDRFFVRLKTQTMSGYYTSSVGLLKDLQYKGIVPIAVYPPCDHPDHLKAAK